MKHILLVGPTIINEGRRYPANVLIVNGLIAKISEKATHPDARAIDARGKWLFPGIIDTHVHFRDPGLTHKGSFISESMAAVAGGVTSFLDMPNTMPAATGKEGIDRKFHLAQNRTFANYGFYAGVTRSNVQAILQFGPGKICGYTDDGLYSGNGRDLLVENPYALEDILLRAGKPVSLHCEDESLIAENLRNYQERYGPELPVELHPLIRSEAACLNATKLSIEMANKTGGRLHLLHLSTAKETQVLTADADILSKKVTAEVCIHHLWFSGEDYSRLGPAIKWNPAIKQPEDREALLKALVDDRIDIVSTDHAPHLWREKMLPYHLSPSGGPMVQHGLLAMLELERKGNITLEQIAVKMCHNPARLFGLDRRGFIREGYWADLTLVSPNEPYQVKRCNLFYKCGWSPMEGQLFGSSIHATFVNGRLSYFQGQVVGIPAGAPLTYDNQ